MRIKKTAKINNRFRARALKLQIEIVGQGRNKI